MTNATMRIEITNGTDAQSPGIDIFTQIKLRDAQAMQPKARLVTRYALVWEGRASLKLYTKMQIEKMAATLARRGVLAYGSPLKVTQYVHSDGRITY